jgi:hypothetical protein
MQAKQGASTQAGGLQRTCPLEELAGETVDMLEQLNFDFYDHVSCKENAQLRMTAIGRRLGASHGVGELMSCWGADDADRDSNL